MKRIVLSGFALACLAGWVFPVEAAKFKGERWAVVIGVEEYQHPIPTLTAPIKDAESIYQFLLSPKGGGFDRDHIRFLKGSDVSRNSIASALGTFLSRVSKKDFVLVYLSGHGMPDPQNTKRKFFLPSEAKAHDLSGTAVRMDQIYRWIDESPAAKKLIIADVCHSGAITGGGAAKGPNTINPYMKKLANSYEGLVVITSSQADQLSQEFPEEEKRRDPQKQTSVFTYYLLQALGPKANEANAIKEDRTVDINEAYEWVRDEVREYTNFQQTPDHHGDLGIGLPLAVVSQATTTVTGRTEEQTRYASREQNAWSFIKDSDNPEHFREYLKEFGEYAPHSFEARLILKDLSQRPSLDQRASIPSKSDDAPPGMVWIPGGTFMMGTDPEVAFKECQKYSDKCNKSWYTDEAPHKVTLDGFYMDRYEVTQEDFEREMGSNPSSNKGAKNPVEKVIWDEARSYCEKVGKRLPTEAEWEYAAKGGKNVLYPWGDTFDQGYSNFCDRNCTYEWKRSEFNDKYETWSPVGKFKPTSNGLYDMGGNVWEWVSDWYSSDAYKNHSRENPSGPSSGSSRVVRGGSWINEPYNLRAGSRFYFDPPERYNNLGFRCAQ